MAAFQTCEVAMRSTLKQTIAVLSALLLIMLTSFSPVNSQEARRPRIGRTSATYPASRNREIPRLVSEINARNIERTIRKLVSFGTRNTLSSQDDPQSRHWRCS